MKFLNKHERDRFYRAKLKGEEVEKPQKNKVRCPCSKTKQLFELETKALNFIRYNAEKLSYGGENLRCYYCVVCGGWHLTSKAFNPKYESKAKKINDFLKEKIKVYEEEQKKRVKKKIELENKQEAEQLWLKIPEEIKSTTINEFVEYLQIVLEIETPSILDILCKKYRRRINRLNRKTKREKKS